MGKGLGCSAGGQGCFDMLQTNPLGFVFDRFRHVFVSNSTSLLGPMGMYTAPWCAPHRLSPHHNLLQGFSLCDPRQATRSPCEKLGIAYAMSLL